MPACQAAVAQPSALCCRGSPPPLPPPADALPAPGVCAGPASRTGSVMVGDILFEVDGQNGVFAAAPQQRCVQPHVRCRRVWSVRAEAPVVVAH